jgi:hypothetical protein
MKTLRSLFVITSMLVLSSGMLSAQAAKVTCKDGSKSGGGQGACSGHGGIAVKATAKANAKAAKADVKVDAKVAKANAKAAMSEAKADTKAAAAKIEQKADAKMAKADEKMAKANAKMAKADAKMDTKMAMEDREAKGATAVCKDKTYSHAKTHQGACSSHGGVAKFLD